MAWTTPPTFTSGNVLTAAQMNILGDDLKETAAGIATTAGAHFVATGSNALGQRLITSDVIDSIATTTNTTYVNSGMPACVVTSGALALVMLYCYSTINTNSETAFYGFVVTGTSSQASNDNRAIANARFTSQFAVSCSAVVLVTGLTPGTNNVFTAGVRVTNVAATGTWDHRRLAVMPF
jgi:hypothetical protein